MSDSSSSAIAATLSTMVKKLRSLRNYQKTSLLGRVVNIQSLISPHFRYMAYGTIDPWKEFKDNKFKKLQTTMDTYIQSIVPGESKYRKIRDGGSGCVSIRTILVSIYTYYLKKLIRPPTRHYAKIRALLLPYSIEPLYLPFSGKKGWNIARRAFHRAKFPFWTELLNLK